MYEIKTEDVYEGFSSNNEIFDLSNYSTKPKYCDDKTKLFIGKMNDETCGGTTEEFVGLKTKMYWFLVEHSSEHKKAKGANRNDVAAMRYNEYKGIWNNGWEIQWIEFKVKIIE